jgi:DNA replication protein DnaC
MVKDFDFASVVDRYSDGASVQMPEAVNIRIPDAEARLRGGLNYFVNKFSRGGVERAVWSEANYRPIAEWMTDNKGRGLLMLGRCGLGKTLIGKYILPYLIRESCGRILNVFNAQELNSKPDEIMRYHLVYIDDIGTEDVSNIYGNKRIPFMELCDAVEQEGKLLICSTNLTIDELIQKYGDRTIDRLKATTKVVSFAGNSLRR